MLDERDVPNDPMELFHAWHAEAGNPASMALGTATLDGTPSVRIVLLKGADDRGFELFTNYEGDKARDLDATGKAALTFQWPPDRQVRVTGPVERVTAAASDAYWATRPRPSQLGAWASKQSAVIAGRAALEAQLAEVTARFSGADVPRPPFWGGYRVVAHAIEFWHHRDDRLHDRVRYRRQVPGDVWVIERLSP